MNPQKLAGQCAKLKCCLNYEVDAYVECQKRLPSKEIELETADATYYYFKADILGGTITYSTDKSFLANECTISARRAFEIINMNRRGEKPEKLEGSEIPKEERKPKDLLEQESLTRFDKNKNSKNKKKKNKGGQPQQPNEAGQPAEEKAVAEKPQNKGPKSQPKQQQQQDKQQEKQQPQQQQQKENNEQAKPADNRPRNQRNKNRGNNPNRRQQSGGNQGEQKPKQNNQQRQPEGKANVENLPQ